MNQSLIESVVLPPSLKASSREEAFAEILDHMVEGGAIAKSDHKGIYQQLLAREELGSTGLGNGVAVPHVKEAPVDGLRLAVAISEAGIPFAAIDGRPVHILFLVLGPCGAQPVEHLSVLRWVSGLARNGDFRRFALAAGGSAGLRDLLVEMADL